MTGVGFDLDAHGTCSSGPLRPSLDRIDGGGPYTTRNVLVTTWFWNRLRGDLPLSAALALLKRSARKACSPVTG